MRQLIPRSLCALIFTILLISCQRDHLYYATEEKAIVRFHVDWKPSQLEPNGVSAFIFDHNSGKIIGQNQISNNPNQIDIALPVGKYDVVLHNNTEYELNNINFRDITSLASFKALIVSSTESKYKSIQSTQLSKYTTETDVLAHSLIKAIEITPQEVKYYPERPDNGYFEVSKEIQVAPQRITETIDIEVYVKNITSAAGAPCSQLTNMSSGYWFGEGNKYEELVTHEFILNSRMIDPENPKNGTIRKKFVAFGPHRSKQDKPIQAHQLIMNFTLTNGKKYQVEAYVKDKISVSHNGVNYVNTLRLEIELPESIGNGGGAFDPDVEDWDDVEVELPV